MVSRVTVWPAEAVANHVLMVSVVADDCARTALAAIAALVAFVALVALVAFVALVAVFALFAAFALLAVFACDTFALPMFMLKYAFAALLAICLSCLLSDEAAA
jgi:hypothetical protein